MAWTTPTTRSTGDLVTAAIWNTDLVDNLSYVHDNLPACRVYNSANIAVVSGVQTFLTFDSERFDTDTIHSTATNTGRLTCQTAGVYLITATYAWSASTGANVNGAAIRLNGTTIIAQLSNYAGTWYNHLAAVYKLAANDYVEFGVSQATGGSLNIVAAGNYSSEFGMVRIAGG